MGTLTYGFGRELKLDDRVLAHLQLAITTKLRAHECFMLDLDGALDDDTARRCVWIESGIPLEFQFDDRRPQALNRHWVEALVRSAQGARGMRVMGEGDVEDYLSQAGAPTAP
jgi:hypothetical protein